MMMKVLTSLLLLTSASGFAPPMINVAPARAAPATQLQLLSGHLAALEDVAVSSGQDAIKVKIMACDNNECVMVDGWKDKSGRWQFSEPNDASASWKQSPEYSYKLLMMEIDDIE